MNKVEFEGKTYTLLTDAALHQDSEFEGYTADALGEDGYHYTVRWVITHPDFDNLEDESEACDWDKVHSVEGWGI